MRRRASGRFSVMVITAAVLLLSVLDTHPARAEDGVPQGWVGDFGVGFLANTVDGTAFAFDMGFDRFVMKNVSVGPLFQLANTPNLVQTGLSGQAKYWIDLARGQNPIKLALTGGIGFVHASHGSTDTSFLIPIGAELDFEVNPKLHLTGSFLLNFTDLKTGPNNDTSVMPGLTVGVRF